MSKNQIFLNSGNFYLSELPESQSINILCCGKGEGGGMTTQLGSRFEANPGQYYSICSKTFAGEACINNSLLQVLLHGVDGSFCLLKTMLAVIWNRGSKLFVNSDDPCSATIPEEDTLPVGDIVLCLFEHEPVVVQYGILCVLLSARDEHHKAN